MANEADNHSIVGQTIGRYRVLSLIAVGGMGEVYLAEDAQLRRKVAIKLLPLEAVASDDANKRLRREARLVANLDHPNICAIHEVGEADGRGFIVMQFVEGETLEARIKRQPLDLREALDLAVQIADALTEAHVRGIIHCDIKPANVMLTPRGQAKVMDFGLAKVLPQVENANASDAATEALLSAPGMVIGTVPYMSPEQVRGEALDVRSDIFSLGVLLYEMLSGQRPFVGGSSAATASAILTQEPPPPKLMVQGRYDENTPLRTAAEPVFKLLREPKRLIIFDGGHVPPMEFFVPTTINWLDETLGPVRRE